MNVSVFQSLILQYLLEYLADPSQTYDIGILILGTHAIFLSMESFLKTNTLTQGQFEELIDLFLFKQVNFIILLFN